MFIRKKKNKTGSISVQVIDKSSGKYKVRKTLGSSNDSKEIEKLEQEAEEAIKELTGEPEFNFEADREKEIINTFYNSIEAIKLLGPELLLGKIFDSIGFNRIDDELFRYLVITRLVYPVSKLKTVDYLYKYKGVELSIYKVYRYLDKLHKEKIGLIQQISYNHAVKVMEAKMSVVFYDVTTLYFEAEEEDDLRKTGFSKEGRHQNPQIVLGLLVNAMGFPLGYEIFEGNKHEGHTMLTVLETFKKKYSIDQLIVVADSGLMSAKNIQELTQQNYKYILGARIKNESEEIKAKILSLTLNNGQSSVMQKPDEQKLIISYSANRAKKDAYNRNRGVAKLEKLVKTGMLSKKHITNRGYNKFLKITGEAKVSIDKGKLKDDKKWDGLKGYLTNTDLSNEEVISQYKQLWQIEKAFRISKTDLRIRPIYHHIKRRIETHICIAFAACVIYKELERQLKQRGSSYSPEQVIDILKTIYELRMIAPFSKDVHTRLLLINEEQKDIMKLFDIQYEANLS